MVCATAKGDHKLKQASAEMQITTNYNVGQCPTWWSPCRT